MLLSYCCEVVYFLLPVVVFAVVSFMKIQAEQEADLIHALLIDFLIMSFYTKNVNGEDENKTCAAPGETNTFNNQVDQFTFGVELQVCFFFFVL